MNKQHVIFLCRGNSARSQMAEAFLRMYGGDRFEVHSAGLEPKGMHPLTAQVMEERGVSIAGHYSKSAAEFLGKVAIRYTIMVCARAEQECPQIWPFGATVLSWPFEDPAACVGGGEKQLAKFREVREQIEGKVCQWLSKEMGVG